MSSTISRRFAYLTPKTGSAFEPGSPISMLGDSRYPRGVSNWWQLCHRFPLVHERHRCRTRRTVPVETSADSARVTRPPTMVYPRCPGRMRPVPCVGRCVSRLDILSALPPLHRAPGQLFDDLRPVGFHLPGEPLSHCRCRREPNLSIGQRCFDLRSREVSQDRLRCDPFRARGHRSM
jgi:hypothetical protein